MREYTLCRQKKDFQGKGSTFDFHTPNSPAADSLPVPIEEQRAFGSRSIHDISVQGNVHAQSGSILFTRVPVEVRLAIWEHAIGRQEIHIVHKYRRLGHVVCDARYWTENRSEKPGLRASSYMYTYASLPPRKQLADWSMCSLLLTCRKMYAKTYVARRFLLTSISIRGSCQSALPKQHFCLLGLASNRSLQARNCFVPLASYPVRQDLRDVLPGRRHRKCYRAEKSSATRGMAFIEFCACNTA
jgi:hypothetical protein